MNRLKRLFLIIETSFKLGINNVVYVAYYRFTLSRGIRKKRFPIQSWNSGDLFDIANSPERNYTDYIESSKERGDEILEGRFIFYHHHKFNLGSIPNWFVDPFSDIELNKKAINKHWTDTNEFDLNTGDIKNLWELSRFDWVTDLSRAYASTQDRAYLERLNKLLNDWAVHNPLNQGINWKCGQEASIRVFKLFNASIILGVNANINKNLFYFILGHLDRVDKNIRYAIAQDNNHGTSESAGLYIGSLWLLSQNNDLSNKYSNQLEKYRDKGRRLLENRIQKLILRDGSFAQKSLTYHRVVIDTLSYVLYAIKLYKEDGLKDEERLYALGEWLLDMISSDAGEVSNIGANDGAMFENLHNNDYRDFRPSLSLYFALLDNRMLWNDKKVNEVLFWRGIEEKDLNYKEPSKPVSYIKDNEFVQLAYKDIIIRIIATQDNFRPGNDVLHLDLWYKGKNLLLDSGSYSYNHPSSDYYKSILSHNTLSFGGGEATPRLSRFLNGKWVRVKGIEIEEDNEIIAWSGGYKDYRNNTHIRRVVINKSSDSINIIDAFVNRSSKNTFIRYNISEDFDNYGSIEVFDKGKNRLKSIIEKQYHSLYYMERREHNQIKFMQGLESGSFNTIINLK